MNKLFLAFYFLCIANNLSAQLIYDKNNARYFSLPSIHEINQNEYHQLVWSCKDILRKHEKHNMDLLAQFPQLYRSSEFDAENKSGKEAVKQFLLRTATITSLRLLADLEEINFNI